MGKWRGPLPNRDLDCAVTTDHDEWRWQWHHHNVWNGETIRISGSHPRHLQVLRNSLEHSATCLPSFYLTDDTDSYLSFGLALLTLSPILLMASYASLAIFTRELTILIMWAGQLLCEATNYLLKHLFQHPRPNGSSHVSDVEPPMVASRLWC